MYLNGFSPDQNLGPGKWGRAERKMTMGSNGVRMKSGCSSTCCVSLFSFVSHIYQKRKQAQKQDPFQHYSSGAGISEVHKSKHVKNTASSNLSRVGKIQVYI